MQMEFQKIALLLILACVTLIILLCIAIYHALFSLRISYPEGVKSDAENTFYKHTTFSQCKDWANVDTSAYFLDKEKHPHFFEEVTFKSRDNSTVHGWLLTHGDKRRPVIVMVHGFRLSKRHYTVLIPSQMLFNAGYDVLSIDLRNHGKSSKTASVMATFGSSEHFDVIGAIDYLFDHNITSCIGVYGASMGGATSIIATAQDDRIKATFVDSPICDAEELIKHHLSVFSGKYLANMLLFITRFLTTGLNIAQFPPFEYNPLLSLKKMGNRPIHFEHTKLDVIVPLSHSQQCSKLAQESGAIVTTHFLPSNSKTRPSLFNYCWDHCVNVLSDPISYQKRLVNFFWQHLPINGCV